MAPNYDYECPTCNTYTEHFVSFDNRHDLQSCRGCGGSEASYVISVPNLTFFEPYHDESLNCDIKGARHRKEVMAAQGVHEAGDRVGGARNFEKASNNGGMMPLNGRSHDDVRRNDDKRREQGDNMVVGVDTSNAHGETTTTYHRVKDLESKSETTSKSIGQIIREG